MFWSDQFIIGIILFYEELFCHMYRPIMIELKVFECFCPSEQAWLFTTKIFMKSRVYHFYEDNRSISLKRFLQRCFKHMPIIWSKKGHHWSHFLTRILEFPHSSKRRSITQKRKIRVWLDWAPDHYFGWKFERIQNWSQTERVILQGGHPNMRTKSSCPDL